MKTEVQDNDICNMRLKETDKSACVGTFGIYGRLRAILTHCRQLQAEPYFHHYSYKLQKNILLLYVDDIVYRPQYLDNSLEWEYMSVQPKEFEYINKSASLKQQKTL